MKQMRNLLFILVLAFGAVSVSQATVIDFESFSLNDVVSGPGVFPDVVFTAGSQDIAVNNNAALLGPAFGGNNCVRAVPNFSHTDPFRADFLVTVDSVSVVMGDNGGDDDALYLTAYDVFNNPIASDANVLPLNVKGGLILTVSAAGIDHVIFGSLQTDFVDPNPNSIYWDNFSYFKTVYIAIKPEGDLNLINPKSHGKVPVAILSTEEFDAPDLVDRDSLTFGATGDEGSLAFCSKPWDVNDDGLKDLACHFYAQSAGFECGDTTGTLKGTTKQGTTIVGIDSVRIVPCK